MCAQRIRPRYVIETYLRMRNDEPEWRLQDYPQWKSEKQLQFAIIFYISMKLDCSNAIQALEILGGRISHVHVKDLSISDGIRHKEKESNMSCPHWWDWLLTSRVPSNTLLSSTVIYSTS